MAGPTAVAQLPYPVGTDAPAYFTHIKHLADKLDPDATSTISPIIPVFASTSARDTALPGAPDGYKAQVGATLYHRRGGQWHAYADRDEIISTPSWTPTIKGNLGNPSVSGVTGSVVVVGGIATVKLGFVRTATAGGGYYYVDAPVSIDSAWVATGQPLGQFCVTDGATFYTGFVEATGQQLRFRVQTGTNTLTYIGPGYQAINSGAVMQALITYKAA